MNLKVKGPVPTLHEGDAQNLMYLPVFSKHLGCAISGFCEYTFAIPLGSHRARTRMAWLADDPEFRAAVVQSARPLGRGGAGAGQLRRLQGPHEPEDLGACAHFIFEVGRTVIHRGRRVPRLYSSRGHYSHQQGLM